ncbi:PQQ-binding-like beta-propeller repeat protein [candidate division KSB1 bacterium]|nr:PQQ-binding-like beta-propeller repeat protein [candidate division KSB1 bacterium]NIR69152.1 PQQ-binding-like beta-propeller repeat protein [candidate division KSB1 bacterium]NIS25663.1 PQQ-binding-like beta-propeller repeat protein [candidate division KSB1 bacterium]NIT72531.1 PQQ-binding-like beta-propeller repeat protein [candidate division KSB1 bacterium]NIU26340.1 PQQ-binding-like beta-propeller repeat protein [candidate division KSB1 bacterium]
MRRLLYPVGLLYLVSVVFLSEVAFASPVVSGKDWPSWRGQNYDGKWSQSDVFKFDEGYGIKLAWKKPLGSGYSSVSIADGLAVTMFSDSTFDYIVAFDAQTGDEQWRHKVDSTYIGHDGSHNGPISTPVIAGDKVIALGPKGQLVTLDLETGKEIWSTHLVEEHKAQVPTYGFATCPLVYDKFLIVETGGTKGNAITSFHKDTGEILWSTGADTIHYQSPITVDLGDQTQLLCVGDKQVYGMMPETGEIIWNYRHGGGLGHINPVMVDQNRVFLHYKWSESMLLSVTEKEGQFSAEEVWKSRNIKGTYCPPIYYDGHLYGYSGNFLTCIEADSGESVWKSRQPGDGFLILVDGHLVIQTKKGTLHIAKASPEGYEEIASLKLFDELAWTPPSFADNRIYTRSLSEIACLDITKSAQLPTIAEKDVFIPGTKFAQFIKEVNQAEDKKALIDEFMDSHEQLPVIEEATLVHFVYRGEAKDMAIAGHMFGYDIEEPMTRIEGTNFFYYSTKLEPDAMVNYRFIRDFEESVPDSLNSNRAQTIFGEFSSLAMPKWTKPDHFEEPEGVARGRLDTLRFESNFMEGSRKLDIYLPPKYDETDKSYPVAYVHWGAVAQNFGKMTNTLDNLIGKSVSPLIVVFIHQLPPARGQEFLGDLKEKYAESLVEELVPFVDENYRTVAAPEARANIGMGFSGFGAFYSTFKYPGTFGKVSGQSTFLLTEQENELKSLISDAQTQPLEIYLDWGKYDYRSPVEAWDIGKANKWFANYLESKGYTLAGGEVNEGFSWINWRNRTDKILKTFFPLQKSRR